MVSHWNKKEKAKVEVTRSYAIKIYHKHMGGVDLTDFLVSGYHHNLKHRSGI